MVRDLNKYDIMAHEAAKTDQPLAWFEKVYDGAKSGELEVPWGNLVANPFMNAWLDAKQWVDAGKKTALKIGSGLGDDAEELCRRGFQTTAFDIAPTAIAMAAERFPDSAVNYQVADLFNPPENWQNNFDVVIEIFTIQALPLHFRSGAFAKIASFLKPGGKLFVVCFARTGTDAEGNPKPIPKPMRMPWPLTKKELATFESVGLTEVSCKEVADPDNPKVRRFIAEYTRP